MEREPTAVLEKARPRGAVPELHRCNVAASGRTDGGLRLVSAPSTWTAMNYDAAPASGPDP